jgi:transposase InsO family protein
MLAQSSKSKHSLKVPEITGIDISVDQLKTLQAQDETLKFAWEWSKDPTKQDGKYTFVVQKGILYRACRDKRGETQYQLVVPKELRDKVFSLGHETLLSGHRGVGKTVGRISQDFYYPGMYQDLKDKTMSCDVCQRSVSKGSVGKAPMGKLPLIGIPFSVVCVDLIGPLSPPSDGNQYILTIIDQCTRFPEAIPLKNIETVTVAEALMSVFSRVGLPHKVHSDCGSQFTSAMMDEVYRLMSIKRSTTAPYNPAGNGIVENFNKTIKNMLKKVAVERPKDWSRYLAPLMFAVRDTAQDSTGFSPFELLYGRTVRTPMTLLKELWTGEVEEPEVKTTYQYVLDLRERIEQTCALAQEELGKVQTRNKRYYDRRVRNRQLKVGESVLLLLPTERNKLLLSWQGPFRIVSKVGEVDYRIEMSSGRVKTFHVNMLKRYYHRSEPDPHLGTDSTLNTEPPNNTEMPPTDTAAAVACILEDETNENDLTVRDTDTLPLYNLIQKETVKDVQINPALTNEQKQDIEALLQEYSELFTDIPKVTHLAEHKVVLTQQEPVRSKGYPIPYQMEQTINKELDDMIAMGIIERSDAPYASPIVLVKKSDNTYRMCINFKELNKITIFDPEPMMSPDDIFPKLSGSKFYSTFDFCKGYWAIPMEENSKDCTSFITPRGLMRFRVMPFGMVNAGSTYNRMVRKLLEGSTNLESYVDDIIGYSQNWAYHLSVLRDLFERVKRANLSLKPSKCKIGYDTVDFLGHTLKTDFIGPQSETVGRILTLKRPQTKRQCRSLLGLVNFYRRYIPNCATLIAPISDLIKNQAPNHVVWGDKQEQAFSQIKDKLSSEPILKLPDLQKDFTVQTDASETGIGACLLQEYEGKNHPVMYASKKLLDREQNYAVAEREALAIVWGINKFHRFLYGRHFTLETDHRSLQYLNTSESKSPRLMRWSLALQPYRYTVKYIRGTENLCADFLSRC